MKIVENEFTKNKKIYALVILIIMISNLFSPYGVLANKVLAAPATGEPYYRLTLLKPSDNPDPDAEDIDDATYYYYYDYMNGMVDTPEEKQARAIVMELSIEGCNSVNSADIYFRWNTDKFVAGQTTKLTRKGTPYLEAATEYTNNSKYPDADFGITNWGSPVYEILDASAGTLRFTGGIAIGSSYLTSGTVVGQFLFLLKDGVTIDDITTDDISLVTGAVGLEQGLQIAYFPDGKTAYHTDGKDYLLFSGFSAGAKQISSVELKTSPTKTQYYVGETLDFTDGELTIKYDDGSEENISIADAISSGKLTADSTVATNSKKVTLTYDSETVDFEYYVLDSLTVSKNLNKMDYEHGDTIEFTGGELTATYKNSAGASTTRVLNIKDELTAGTLIVDKTTAEVDSNVINFNYFGKTATITLTITDPIASISITKQPNLLTYDDGETINLAGGQITPVTKSGKTLTPVATDASIVTSSETTASIAQATNKWTIAGGDGLQAGNQKITLTYEGKTADITIVVNDTVSGVSITTQATAENKYGTPAGALNFDGLVATITTTGGGTFTVGASSLTIDTTTYNPNSVTKQSFPVRYGNISSTNNAEITLSNYIKGISVKFTKTEFEYGTELGNVLAKGTYVENYADGTTSSPKAITSDMVTGYVASPAATLLTNHKYNETLTIKLSTSTNSFDQLPAVATQIITLKDVPVSIDVASKPNKISYDYGETFLTNGGQLKVNYKSGASQNISMGANTVTLTETDGSNINMSPAVSEFVNGKVTKTIKVNYTSDGKTFDTSFDITIKDSVDSIAITTNPKLVFEHNDTFDASTGKLTVTYKSGNSEVVSLDEANITETDGTTVNMAPTASEYTNNQLTKTLKVEYAGLTTNYNITLKNTVASITVTAPTKVTYNLNDSTDLTGGKVTVTRKAGDTKDLALTDTKITVTNFNTSVAGTGKTANVKYTEEGKDYTSTFTYDVVNNITDIEIVAPSKTEYKHGENIATNGTITVKYADGTNSTRTMTESMITENDGSAVNMTPSSYDNSTNKLTKTLKITYTEDGITKTVNYTITIINTLKEVTLYGTPKTNYNVNEAMQPGLSILVTRETGTPETIEVTSDMISNFDTTTEGTKTAVITYTENGVTKTVNYEYTVTDSVTSISIDTAVKEAQKYNEELDLTGATIKVISGKGTKVISLEQSMIKAGTYDKTRLGEQTVTVEYGGQQTTFKVNVKDYVTKIAVNPATVAGTYGDTLTNIINNNNVMYTATYAKAGDKTAVAVAESMVTGYNPNTLTAQNLIVTYTDSDTLNYTNGQDFTTTLTVTLQDEISNIEVTAPTVDQTYNYGGTLDLTGATITVNYVSGATPKTVTPTVNMVVEKGTTNAVNMSPLASEFTNNKLNKQVTLKYTEDGKEGSIDYLVTIVNDVKEVSMNATPKTSYNIGESLDLTNGKITVKRATGTDEVIDLTDPRVTVTGFDSSTENTSLTIMVTFTENGITKQTSYEVSVTDTVTKVELGTSPRTSYKYNEELDLTGSTIKVTKGSGEETVQITESMVTGYDKTILGEQTVTITYGGQQTTFKVNVKDYVTKIAVNPATVTGTYGDTLTNIINNNNVMYTVTYAKAGDKTAVAVAESMVTGYNPNTLTAQNLTVTYTDSDTLSYTNGQDFTATLTVTLQDEISNIEVTAPTVDQTYNYGGTLDLTGATITVNYVSGATPKTVTPTVNMVVEKGTTNAVNMSPLASEFTNNKLNKQVTLKYTEDGKEGSIDYLVTIVNDVKEVTLYGTPKTNYNVNEAMQPGLSILVTRKTGTPETIEVTSDMISNFDTTTEGTRTAVITYTENGVTKTVNYEYTVTDSVTSISIDTAVKEAQKYNEELDLTGATIKVISGKGTKVISLEQNMIKAGTYNKTTLGEQTVTVEYGGQQTTFKVNVKDYVTKIAVNPATVAGTYGDTLTNIINNNNVMYTVTYAKAGDKTAVAVAESMVTGYNPNTLTAQNLTVTYTDSDTLSYTNGQDFTATLTVTLQDEISNIEVTAPTADQTYNYGGTLDLTGATITVNYVSGATPKTVTPTVNMVVEKGTTNAVNMSPLASEFTNNKLDKQVTLKYTEDGKEGSIDYLVTIVNDVKEVSMNVTPKTSYNIGESLDLTNGKITVTRATGTDEVINLTDSRVTVTGFDSSTENTSLTIMVTFTENGITKQTSYEVSVTDIVTKIELGTSPRTSYKYNEELDLTGSTIKVTKGSGEETVQITESMITGYDKTILGEQTVTITYGGQQTTFKVNVKDYVTKIAVNPATVTGTYGDTLTNIINNNNVMYTVTYAKAGDKTAVAVAESMVTGYNPNTLTAQNLTVTYTDSDTLSYTNGQDFTATLTVTLQDEISNIEVTAPTADQTYNYGGTLDLTGATITVNYVSGATPKTVTPTVNMVVEKGTTNAVNMSPLASEFTNNKLNKQVTLKYAEDGKEGSIDYLVTIVNDVKEVSMNVTPKTSYNIGESLDLTNGKITVTRATGTDEVINLTDSRVTVTGFDSSTENTSLTIMVTFTENGITKQTSYEVSVIDTILSMEIETLPKQNYLYNEPLDVSVGTIKVTRNSGVEVINMTESMVKEMDNTPFNSKKLGTRNLKVTYGGITKTYEVTVSDYVTGIIITPPTKTNYEYNEALDLTGGTVQKVMASGTIVAPVSLTQSMVSGYDATTIGAQTITVNYEGKQGNFGVIVSDNIQTIEMKTTPKTSYKYGETLDVTNGTIEVTRSSGAKEIIAITKNMVTGFNSEILGTQELTVNYNGKQTTYEIEVKDYVKGIEITKPTKLVYNVGETIDLTNGKVKEIMASGSATSPVAMTNSQVTITGFDTTTVGAKTITVKYKGFTKTFSITVVDPTSSMVIKTLPDKLDYKYGEELDLTGGTIQITKTSGSTQILNITKQMISGYNPKKLGSQVITVTYDGKTAEFSVNVEDYVKQLNIKKPTKLEYEYGEELELDGGEVSVVMASGKISDKTALTASMVEGYNKKKEGKQTLKVTYKGLYGKFDVNVVDLVKAISMDKQPNKVKYNYGEELDVTGAVIKVIKSSGIYKIPVTKDMTSDYSATTPGTQIITVTYKNETTNFIVIVGEKPAEPVTPVEPEEPTTPDKPETPDRTTPVRPSNRVTTEEPNVEETVETPNNTEEPTKGEDLQEPQQPQQEKPTATLGDKDEKEDDTLKTKMIAGGIGLAGLLLLLLLLVFKRNTKIYVEEDGEYVLGGMERLTNKHRTIDVDQYLDGNTYPNRVKIVLNKKIAEKLDKQKIEIKHRGKVTKKVIKYNNEEFEITLKELKTKE